METTVSAMFSVRGNGCGVGLVKRGRAATPPPKTNQYPVGNSGIIVEITSGSVEKPRKQLPRKLNDSSKENGSPQNKLTGPLA